MQKSLWHYSTVPTVPCNFMEVRRTPKQDCTRGKHPFFLHCCRCVQEASSDLMGPNGPPCTERSRRGCDQVWVLCISHPRSLTFLLPFLLLRLAIYRRRTLTSADLAPNLTGKAGLDMPKGFNVCSMQSICKFGGLFTPAIERKPAKDNSDQP